MTGEGVLQWIDDTELQHWAFAASVRAAVAAVAAAQPAVQQFQEGGSVASRPAPFQVFGCKIEAGLWDAGQPAADQSARPDLQRAVVGPWPAVRIPSALHSQHPCSAAPSWACCLQTTRSALTCCCGGES